MAKKKGKEREHLDANEDKDKEKEKPKKCLNWARRDLASAWLHGIDEDIVTFAFLKERPILLTRVELLLVDFSKVGVITQPVESILCTLIDANIVDLWH